MAFRAERARRMLVLASLCSLLFAIPHTIEDFVYRVPEERFSLDQTVALWMAGLAFSLQVAGLLLLVAGRRSGVLIGGFFAVLWLVAAVLDHTGDVLEQPFREGVSSTVWVLGIVATQAVAAGAAAVLLSRSRRVGTADDRGGAHR